VSATNFIGGLTGAASLNVLKAGDTMTGNLNMAAQSEIRWQDAVGGEYVGFKAPATIPTSYTVSLPSVAPAARQILSANATTPTNLEWTTSGSFVAPSASRVVYVTQYGNDTTGD